MSSPKPVLISGAGLSGLLLARSLKFSNTPFLLYERDESIGARAQGYRLRISKDGINALKEVLPEKDYEQFRAGTATTDGGAGGINSVNAITGESGHFVSEPGGPKLGGDVLGVSRSYLRQTLFDDEDIVHWGKRTVGYIETNSGVVLKFADGSTSTEGSMLVAADGPHSAITKQLTNDRVRAYDTGARIIHGQSPASAFEQLGEGVWNVADDSNPIGRLGMITNVRPVKHGDNPEFGWVLVGAPGTFSAPNENFSIVGSPAADLSRELTANWHSKFHPIFQQQNDAEAAFLKMSTASPNGVPEWTNSPRVTLMGDAVHCMTPAGGVGANTGFRDAAFIGRLLKQVGGWQEGVTQEYEKEMRAYASENVKMSFEAAAKRFNITELK